MRPRFLLKGFLAITMLLCTTHTWAYDFKADDICYNILSEEDLTCEVTYTGEIYYTLNGIDYHRYESYYSGDFVIPETATNSNTGQTYTVVGIGNYACNDCTDIMTVTGLTSVSIPSTVTTIGGAAFSGCTKLTEITLPENLTSIGGSAFYGCTSLTEITIPSSVTSIGGSAFSNCTSLETVYFNATACSSAGSTPIFNGCTQLSTTVIGENVTMIPAYLFRDSSIEEITIPNSVTSIGEQAFYNCSNLTEVTIGISVTSIGNSAFYSCM